MSTLMRRIIGAGTFAYRTELLIAVAVAVVASLIAWLGLHRVLCNVKSRSEARHVDRDHWFDGRVPRSQYSLTNAGGAALRRP
jgi:hypothetical protein